MQATTFRLPADLCAELKREAYETGRPQQAIVAEALVLRLRHPGLKDPAKRAAALATAGSPS